MLIINFILGLLPIIWLVIALCGLKWPGYKAALGALIIAAVEALTYFGFSMSDTLTSILEGFAFAMLLLQRFLRITYLCVQDQSI